MLFILRQLRRLELRKRSGQYFLYAVGEIVLIVFGILIALQIGGWNEDRREFHEETAILERLKSDFEANQERLKVNDDLWRSITERLRDFQKAMGPNPDTYPDELIHQYVTAFKQNPSFYPNEGVLNSLIASGRIDLVSHEELNYKLNSWPTLMGSYRFTMNYIAEQGFNNSTEFRSHFPYQNLQTDAGRINPRYSGISERMRDFDAAGPIGPSRFPSDQKLLLTSMELQNAIHSKRINGGILVYKIADLQQLHEEILELINEELAKR